MLHNGCNDFLFGVHCVEEGDRIPMLQSYGQALKQKNCFSGVLGDDYVAPIPRRLMPTYYEKLQSNVAW